MEHETSLNFHFAVLAAQLRGPSTNHIPAITPVAFPGLQKLNLTSCILEKQVFLVSYWNTDATAQCLNGNVIGYTSKLHEPVRERGKNKKANIPVTKCEWTGFLIYGQQAGFKLDLHCLSKGSCLLDHLFFNHPSM